ncbi:MAG: hypothetical protein HQ579_01355 [Candidatus Omnitrophica bacterium]|nr:hypothetical protein [Candidatus Omnitrophota bacterium]
MEPTASTVSAITKAWRYLWNVISLGDNVKKVLANQDSIGKHLEDIKSPKEKLTELLVLTDVTEKVYKGKIELLEQKGEKQSQQDKQEIVKLKEEKITLSRYKLLVDEVATASGVALKEKNDEIKKLNGKVEDLKKQIPAISLFEQAAGVGTYAGIGSLLASGALKSVSDLEPNKFSEALKDLVWLRKGVPTKTIPQPPEKKE